MTFTQYIKKFWDFLKEDTWQSWLVSLILIIIFIKFIFFPVLSLITATPLPLVVVESCSMYHDSSFDEWWDKNAAWYESKNIEKADFEEFSFKNGLNKGDIIFVWGRADLNLGDIIIFNADAQHPIIHRLVTLNPLSTKGDNGKTNSGQSGFEQDIPEQAVLGKSAFKIPAIGWIKLIFFEPFQSPDKRGFCN